MAEEKKTLTRSELEIIIKRRAAVLLIVLAALVAVNSFFKDGNSGRIMKDIIAANNQWAWYQAKNGRGVSYEIASLTTSDKALKEKFAAEKERMDSDKKEIAEKARAMEHDREVAKKSSPWIGYANTGYQLAIVLLSASILAVSMPLFWTSFVVAGIGILLSAQGLFLFL